MKIPEALNKLNSLSKKQQGHFILLFAVIIAILSVPLLFVKIKYDFHLYIIFTLAAAIAVCFKVYGITEIFSESEKINIGFIVFALSPVLTASIVAKADASSYIYKNLLIVFIPYMILFFVFRRSAVSISVTSVICFLLYTINDIVKTVRGTELALSDFLALKTALSVASNYRYELTGKIYYAFLCVVSMIAASCAFPFNFKNLKGRRIKIDTIAFCTAVFAGSTAWLACEFYRYDTIRNWSNQDLLDQRGICYNLTLSVKEHFKKAPEGYSRDKIYDILSNIPFSSTGGGRRPI